MDAIALSFDRSSSDLLVAKIKASEVDAYSTLDKFVSWLDGLNHQTQISLSSP